MPCVTAQVGSTSAILCVRGRKPKRCFYCDKPATLLCDFPKGRKSCDRAMCDAHAVEVDRDLHQCSEHCEPGLF